MANTTLKQVGVFDLSSFMRKCERNIGNYEYFNYAPVFDRTTILDAGKKKGRFHLGVYNGGWTVAMCLDLMIRNHSKGGHSINNLLADLDAEFGGKRPWALTDIVRVASKWAGRDLSRFFADYVVGDKTVPVADFTRLAGLTLMVQEYAAEAYLVPDPRATPRQLRVRRGWLGG